MPTRQAEDFPGGRIVATIVYSNLIRKTYKKTPILIRRNRSVSSKTGTL